MRRSSHSARVARLLGEDQAESISRSFRGWYGTPVALAGVPGDVWIGGDGDFVGNVDAGSETSLDQMRHDYIQKIKRARVARAMRQGGGFGTIAEVQLGTRKGGHFWKSGVVNTTNACESLWTASGHPGPGNAASAAPGGNVFNTTSAGGYPYINSVSGQTTHVVGAMLNPQISNASLVMYDRLWGVTKTMNSTATEAVSGTPAKYQNTTTGAVDSAENNFLFIETRTLLSATAHNWTTCTYTDQSGNTGATLPSVTGISSCAVGRCDMPTSQWFCPLAAGDTGIKALTQMQCSALVASGAVDFIIGHPLAMIPSQSIGFSAWMYGINSAFNFVKVMDDACIAFLGVYITGGSTQNFRGYIELCES